MATEKLKIVLDAAWKGKGAINNAERDLKGVDKAAERGKSTLKGLGIVAGVAGAAIAGAAVVAKAAWSELGRGAELNNAAGKFENLTESIGSSADTMLSRMKDATDGMVSQADLISGANEIMQGKLAKSEDSVVRLSAASGALNWDMGVLAQTINNQSVLRLDNLGLAVEDVIPRFKELQATMGDKEAFGLAVIEAGEAVVELIGETSETTAGKMQMLVTAAQNARNAFSAGFAEGAADEFGLLADNLDITTDSINRAGMAWGEFVGRVAVSTFGKAVGIEALDNALKAGIITQDDYRVTMNSLTSGIVNASDVLEHIAKAQERFNLNIALSVRGLGAQIAAASSADRVMLSYAGSVDVAATAVGNMFRLSRDFSMIFPGITKATYDQGAAWRNNTDSLELSADAARDMRREGYNLIQGYKDVSNVIQETDGALTGYASTARDAASAMDDLAAATGSYFMQARKSDDFNPFEAALEAAAGKGANAFQLSQFGIAGGLFNQEEATGFMNEAFMMQQAEGAISDMILAGDIAGAAALVSSLEAGLTEGKGLAEEFFKGINDEVVEPLMDLDTSAATNTLDIWIDENKDITFQGHINMPSGPGGGGGDDDNIPIDELGTGGPVSANTPYIVGDRGRELFVPNSNGTIIPNSQLGGGGVVINTYTKEAAAVAMAMAWQQNRSRF
jgi:hypothetical protein